MKTYNAQLIRGLHNLTTNHYGCVATLGNFDGLHLGHQQVLKQLQAKAKILNLPTTVITFEPLPQEYFNSAQAPARLLRFGEKFRLLHELGINRILCLKFNKELSQLSAEDFVINILVKKLGVKYLIVGDDFRFGYQRQGDFNLLTAMGKKFGFEVLATPTFTLNGQRVGSSLVRSALAEGNLNNAAELLGKPFTLQGKVIYGDQQGRQLGFPTANILLQRIVLPVRGVFTVKVSGIEEKPILGVANVGNRPTVKTTRSLLEVYLLNFNGNIYGRFLQVEFLHKLRDERRFASLEELKQQIARDVAQALELFSEDKA